MVKIIIYEDSERDLINRYSRLTQNHDIHVRHSRRADFGPASLAWDHESFREHGFNPDNFMNGFGNPKEESAEIYFLDGLNGYCFRLLEDLPKERAFINSDSNSINEQAEREGYQVVKESIENIITKVN